MTNPRHHPSDDTLAAYAAGALEPGFGLVVGAHVEGCAHCRARVRSYEAVSGEALEALPNTDMAPGALATVLGRLDGPAPSVDRRPLAERLTLLPKKWVAPGVWVAPIDTPHAPENRVYLLNVAPGGLTARHSHSGAEFCTVLKGAYRDKLGLFSAGDFAEANGDFNHKPIVEGNEDCLCLFATEGRLKPVGMVGRIAFNYADV